MPIAVVCIIVQCQLTNNIADRPLVDIVPSAIPPHVCNDIIYKSEREIGYRLFPDSIDKNEPNNLDQSAQEIYIYHKGKVVEQSLCNLIEPHLPKLTDAIRRRGQRVAASGLQFADMECFREPKIEWIFLRKYFPLGRYSKRNSLKVHMDSNMHSVTLALNDNYKGGGLMVVRPRVNNDSDENATKIKNTEHEFALRVNLGIFAGGTHPSWSFYLFVAYEVRDSNFGDPVFWVFGLSDTAVCAHIEKHAAKQANQNTSVNNRPPSNYHK